MEQDQKVVNYLRGIESSGFFELPSSWWQGEELPPGRSTIDLYAMPAATQLFLDDKGTDLRSWIVSEIKSSFEPQLEKIGPCAIGPVTILRDPFSAKPYIVFYATAPAVLLSGSSDQGTTT